MLTELNCISTIQYNTIQCSTVLCSTLQYSTVQYSTVQYCVLYCTVLHCTAPRYDVLITLDQSKLPTVIVYRVLLLDSRAYRSGLQL